MKATSKIRFWELDLLKGVALVLMIIFHIIFDLNLFASTAIDLNYWPLKAIGFIAASLFIFVSGIANSISVYKDINRRTNDNNNKQDSFYTQNTKRSLYLFALALSITLVTFIFFKTWTIWFGILHFFALAGLLTPFLYHHTIISILLYNIGMLIKYVTSSWSIKTYSLLWLGFIPDTFKSFDYFPLLPWLGFSIFGVIIAHIFYTSGKRQQYIFPKPNTKIAKWLILMGTKTLFIYLIHQPIIIALLYLINCFLTK